MAGEHGTDWMEVDGEMEQAKRKTGRRWLDETGKKSDGGETPLSVAPDREGIGGDGDNTGRRGDGGRGVRVGSISRAMSTFA